MMGLMLLLLADVAVLQARMEEMDVLGLRAEINQVKERVVKLEEWEEVKAEEPGSDRASSEISPSPAPQKPVAEPVQTRTSREVYVPMGSGSTRSQDWSEVAGQAYIDTRDYNIREAYFEASLKANSGRVWARLLNKNEATYVYDSQISHNTPTSTLIRSGKLALPGGNKLYAIQLKSENQQEVFIESARVRLVVE